VVVPSVPLAVLGPLLGVSLVDGVALVPSLGAAVEPSAAVLDDPCSSGGSGSPHPAPSTPIANTTPAVAPYRMGQTLPQTRGAGHSRPIAVLATVCARSLGPVTEPKVTVTRVEDRYQPV
jgi:hypothetical protein